MGIDVTATAAGAPALLKVLGEPMRWQIVVLLAAEDLCTCHLVEALGAAQPLVSHHLRVLREAGVVSTEPCGAFTYYRLEREPLAMLVGELGSLNDSPEGGRRRRPCT